MGLVSAYIQRTRVANSMLLTQIPPKIQALKVLYYVLHCANEYEKEKKKMTIITKYHWELPTGCLNCGMVPKACKSRLKVVSHVAK